MNGWKIVILYSAPFIPPLTRGNLCWRFRGLMKRRLCEAELDRVGHQAYLSPLTGFSFAALLAVLLLRVDAAPDAGLVTFYLLTSFLAYFAALHLQNFKSERWEDQLGTALGEVGSLALLLSILAALHWTDQSALFIGGSIAAAD